jgi:hypothetical protein
MMPPRFLRSTNPRAARRQIDHWPVGRDGLGGDVAVERATTALPNTSALKFFIFGRGIRSSSWLEETKPQQIINLKILVRFRRNGADIV